MQIDQKESSCSKNQKLRRRASCTILALNSHARGTQDCFYFPVHFGSTLAVLVEEGMDIAAVVDPVTGFVDYSEQRR